MASVTLDQLCEDVADFRTRLLEKKHGLATPEKWYRYDSLSNISHLDRLLQGSYRDLTALAAERPIADIGGGDGDLAFFLSEHGFEVDMIDCSHTRQGGLDGPRALAKQFAGVAIHDIDLDSQFSLPRERYGLVLFLGILYHLQNPLYALNQLAHRSDHIVLSTRIAARAPGRGPVRGRRLKDIPVAYLVGPRELNNDPTNYWIFSKTGLRRLLERAGWELLEELVVGRTIGDSDPVRADRDERVFLLARSDTAHRSRYGFAAV